MTQRVLITGSAGRLGRAAVAALVARGHFAVGFDLRPTPGLPEAQSVVSTLHDPVRLAAAMSGIDCLIHLAATPDDAHFPRPDPPNDTDNFENELVPNNVVGGYRVMEAARKAGVPKVVLASTGQVIDGHLDAWNIPIVASASYQPRYLYACTKVFLEALGQVYAANHGMKVIAARLGWCPRDAGQVAQIRASVEDQDVYLSPGDAGRFVLAAVETPAAKLPPFAPVYVTSRPSRHLLYDLAPARRLIGFVPQDQWPTGAEEF
jgi:nucleoside-diphosphate-sugar epimerase